MSRVLDSWHSWSFWVSLSFVCVNIWLISKSAVHTRYASCNTLFIRPVCYFITDTPHLNNNGSRSLQYTPIKSRAFINLLVLLINYSKQVTIVDLLQNYPVNSLRMVFVRPSLSDLFTWNFYRVWFSHLTDWLTESSLPTCASSWQTWLRLLLPLRNYFIYILFLHLEILLPILFSNVSWLWLWHFYFNNNN